MSSRTMLAATFGTTIASEIIAAVAIAAELFVCDHFRRPLVSRSLKIVQSVKECLCLSHACHITGKFSLALLVGRSCDRLDHGGSLTLHSGSQVVKFLHP